MAKDQVGPDGRVDGLDINASMLAKARDLADGFDIGWIEGDAASSGQPHESYDVVMSQYGYLYFPTTPAALTSFEVFLLRTDAWPSQSGKVTTLAHWRDAQQSSDTSRQKSPKSNVPRETPRFGSA
ncbi:class I SAM-dependent methyltransferase [Hoeflea sp.]|uniref:class I SAM-dependent methyltransferase n=1 Tax=Hoeflea sp. TaxID=1940281 RepID=UPI003A928467